MYTGEEDGDIIFESELEQLRSRQMLQYHVVLSEPTDDWHGRRGHINREFIEDTVKDLKSSDFFLCGPPPFMEASRAILMGLGVEPKRIMQESFGSPVPKNAQPATVTQEEGMVVEFGRSGKTYTVRGDRHCWRRPKSTESASLHPAGRDSAEPARQNCWREMFEWTPRWDLIPIRKRKAIGCSP